MGKDICLFAALAGTLILSAGRSDAAALERSLQKLSKAKSDHELVCITASATLLDAFSDARAKAEKLESLPHASRLEMISALRDEEATFVSYGYLPFSIAMRPATLNYLSEFNSSARKLSRMYDIVINLVSRDKGLEQAQKLIDEKNAISRPVGKWHCRLSYPRQNETFTWELYSDFTVNPDHDGRDAYPKSWILSANSMVIINVCPGSPRGGFKDVCKVRWDEQQFEARNQRGGMYVGHRVN